MASTHGSDTLLPISGVRRLSLADEGALVEVRGPRKTWLPSHVIRYDQIVAVYRYETRDWGYVAVLSLYWFGAFLAVSIASIIMQDPGFFLLIAAAVVSVGIVALGAYRILTAPKRQLRIEIVGQPPLILPNRCPGFFAQLASRLPKSESVPDAPAPVESPVEEPLPSPEPTDDPAR